MVDAGSGTGSCMLSVGALPSAGLTPPGHKALIRGSPLCLLPACFLPMEQASRGCCTLSYVAGFNLPPFLVLSGISAMPA